MKKNPKSDEDYQADQIYRLVAGATFARNMTLTCQVCDAQTQGPESGGDGHFVRQAYDAGWRVKESERLRTFCVMCPQCVAKPDSERGKE